ncbi:MAG: serine protease, partial [Acidobacteriota bacterium]
MTDRPPTFQESFLVSFFRRRASSLADSVSFRLVLCLAIFGTVLPIAPVGAGDAAEDAAAVSQRTDARPLENPYRDLLVHADALVQVRFVERVRAPGVDNESNDEITCVVVGADGLVLCSQTLLGNAMDVLARLFGRSSAPIASQPRDIEVVGADGTIRPALLVARDSDRDLAWLEIQDLPPDAALPTLEFSAGAASDIEIGATFYELHRLDRYFGGAEAVDTGIVAARVERPRRLLVPARPSGRVGSPVFTADGRPLGLLVVQVPSSAEASRRAAVGGGRLPGQATRVEQM